MATMCLAGALLVLLNWHEPRLVDTWQRAVDRFWILVGIGLWFVAVTINWRAIRPQPFTIGAPRRGTGMITFSLIGVAVLVWLTLRINPGWNVLGFHNSAPHDNYPGRDKQLLCLFGGGALFVLGMMRAADLGQIGHTVRRSWQEHRSEWLLVIVLTAAALAVRVYKLDSLIPVIVSDEPQEFYPARQVADGALINVAGDMQTEQTYLGAFLISYLVDLFGPTLFAGRLFTALTGTLAIPGVYLVARRLFNPLAGVLAALFLIGQPVHVFFSRTNVYQIVDPTIGVYAILLLWSGLERGERWKFALAGVLIGISQNFYTATRLWLVLVPLWLLIVFVRQPRLLARHWVNLIAMLAGGLVILLPVFAQVDQGQVSFTERAVEMSYGFGDSHHMFDITPREFVFERLSPAVRIFLDSGDESMHFEMEPHTALNLKWGFLVFALGLAYALRFALNPRVLLMLMWVGLTAIFAGSVLHYVGHSRYMTVALPMAVLGGVGVAWLVEMARGWLPAHRQPLLVIPALALMLVVTAHDLTFILDKHPKRLLNEVWEERWIADALAKATMAVPHDDSSAIYWVTGTPAWNKRCQEIYGYFHGPIDYIDWNRPVSLAWLSTLDTSQKDLYIFVPPVPDDSPDPAEIPVSSSPVWMILNAFPNATVYRYDGRVYPTDYPSALYALVYVPRGSPFRGRDYLIELSSPPTVLP